MVRVLVVNDPHDELFHLREFDEERSIYSHLDIDESWVEEDIDTWEEENYLDVYRTIKKDKDKIYLFLKVIKVRPTILVNLTF